MNKAYEAMLEDRRKNMRRIYERLNGGPLAGADDAPGSGPDDPPEVGGDQPDEQPLITPDPS